jgi:hypothetical protein
MERFVKSDMRFPLLNVLFLTILLGLFLVSPSGKARGDAPSEKPARISWSAPTYGTPVHHYVLQFVELGGADHDTTTVDNILDEFLDVTVTFGLTYKARVAGVDSLDRQGPWSLWTPIYGPKEDY